MHPASDDLDHVVKQQAERELEDRRFRRAANKPLQMKDFRNLLERTWRCPSVQVVIQQIPGRIAIGIQRSVTITTSSSPGRCRCQLPDIAAFRMVGRPEPTPFLKKWSASGVDS